MVLPALIPVAIAAAGVGVGGGAILSQMLGGGGEESTTTTEHRIHYAPITKKEIHQPFETFYPTSIYSPQQDISYQIITHSPEAKQATKKEMTSDITAEPSLIQPRTDTISPRYEETRPITEGTDMTKIALYGAIALVAYGLISK